MNQIIINFLKESSEWSINPLFPKNLKALIESNYMSQIELVHSRLLQFLEKETFFENGMRNESKYLSNSN